MIYNKKHALVVLLLTMSLAMTVFGDTVETWDGLSFEGDLLTGFPDQITVEMNGAKYVVDLDSITELTLTEQNDMVALVTATGERIQGVMISSVGRITIRTDSGASEIPNDKVKRLSFPYVPDAPPAYSTLVKLTDDVTFEGDLVHSFPRQISIDQNGIIGNVMREKISVLTFGEPSRIETEERTYQGELISDIPDEIELETSYGSIYVRRESVEQIQLYHVPPGWGYSPSSSSSSDRQGLGTGAWVLLILGGVVLLSVVLLLL